MGTPIVKQLVEMSQVRPEDTVTMQAIAASLDARLLEKGITDQDIFHWLRACQLAAYTLGQTDLFRPKAQKQHRKPA